MIQKEGRDGGKEGGRKGGRKSYQSADGDYE